jgi:glycosyltransferase involved in cell wall biosynthesis
MRSPILAKLERDCLSQADWINSFSNFTKSRMGELHGSLADKIEVTPGWADTSRFRIVSDRDAARRQLGWRTDVPILFTLRRLVRRMGLDRLIRAAHLLRGHGLQFQLVIGGQGPLREPLESLARELGMSDMVLFTGFLPDEVLPLAYGACDAFVLPTAELECFGIIAVEALASGRPVLATPVAAIPEIINRVEPKWLASGTDPQSIATLLRQFLRGDLPAHDPGRLRSITQEHWSFGSLHRFCYRALGIDDNDCVNRTKGSNSFLNPAVQA